MSIPLQHDHYNASNSFYAFMSALGLEVQDDPHLKDTAQRVSKAFKNDLFKGLYEEPPKVTAFPNDGYDGLIISKDIEVRSMCAHHFLPFFGVAHVGYIPTDKVVGLSKLNRVVDHFSRKPQVQENLTSQIHDYLKEVIPYAKGIAVSLEATHLCCKLRGVRQDSLMVTNKLSGVFLDNQNLARSEFMAEIKG